MNKEEKQRLTDLKFKIKPLIDRLRKELNMTYKSIALIVGKKEAAISKWGRKNDPVKPSYKDVLSVFKTFTALLEPTESTPIENKLSEDIIVNETNPSYNKKAKLVIAFYEFNEMTIDYPYQGVIGEIVELNEKKAIIGHKVEGTLSDIHDKPDMFIYAFDDALEPEIKYGWMVFIKKTQLEDLVPGLYYFFIKNDVKFMRKLEKVEKVGDEWLITMVAVKEKVSSMTFKSNELEVIFRISGFGSQR